MMQHRFTIEQVKRKHSRAHAVIFALTRISIDGADDVIEQAGMSAA
jgi:hypothetical protein